MPRIIKRILRWSRGPDPFPFWRDKIGSAPSEAHGDLTTDGCSRVRFSGTYNNIALVSEFLCGISGMPSKLIIHPPDFLPPKREGVRPFLNRCGAFPGCLSCGPGARTFWAKSIGRAGPLLVGFDRLPQDAAGRSDDQPVAPARKEPLYRRFKRLARLVHEMEATSWFLPRRSLPPGLAPGTRVRLCLIN
jgi:hypothetical protein